MRTLTENFCLRTGRNNAECYKTFAVWYGKDELGNTVAPGEYTVQIEATANGLKTVSRVHKVTVFKVKVSTPCESLDPPYRCIDSFIANKDRTGDNIVATIEPNINASITWICADAPGGVNSGVCKPSTGNGSTFTFIPDPPNATKGRSGSLSYIIKASTTIPGQTATGAITIIQDKLDRLRQEYHDMGKNRQPERLEFVNAENYQNPQGHFPYSDIRSQGDISDWAMFTIQGNLENVRSDIGNQPMPVNSGYRTPKHNASINPPGATNSEHIYGLAADISARQDYNGDGIINRADWDILANAAKNRGACIEPYSMTGGWVHMEWIGTCQSGW